MATPVRITGFGLLAILLPLTRCEATWLPARLAVADLVVLAVVVATTTAGQAAHADSFFAPKARRSAIDVVDAGHAATVLENEPSGAAKVGVLAALRADPAKAHRRAVFGTVIGAVSVS